MKQKSNHKTQKLKTLQICGNSSYGGAGILVVKWCEYLLSHGWQVDVLTTDAYFSSVLKRIPGLKVIDNIYIPREIAPVGDAKALLKLIGLLRRERYQVVHTYTATPGFVGRMAARLAGTPVILHHQAGWTVTEFSAAFQRALYTPLEYLATVASTKSICVSHAVASMGLENKIAPARKLVTICNGIDPEPFLSATNDPGLREKMRNEFGVPDDCWLIGNTSRLSPQKDVDTLIQAMVILKSILEGIPFILLLAGDGPERGKLEELVQNLNLQNHVHLLGFREDIPAFLAGLDIFASPSLWEGLSISLLEAMASAKPIVTTTIPPNKELIEHEVTGLLVPPRSPKFVAEAIARFIREPELAGRCALTAREKVLEYFTLDRMCKQTMDLYNNLLMNL